MKNALQKKYFKLLPHGELTEVLPNIYTITGTMRLFGLFQYSRVMTIFKDGNDLALLNTVRVSDAELKSIMSLGAVKHIFKIGALHNVDIPFYMDHFNPKLWTIKSDSSNHGYSPDFYFDDYKELPMLNAKVQVLQNSKVPEAFIITPGNGGCLHSCDAFVNMGYDPGANWLTTNLAKLLPKPTYIGPNWIKSAKPPPDSMLQVLEYDFQHFVPAHGQPIKLHAKEKLGIYLKKYYQK